MTSNYKGWHISYNQARPVTGVWRAERFGVGLSAGTAVALEEMIDRREAEKPQPQRLPD